jgi:hypothetical protein
LYHTFLVFYCCFFRPCYNGQILVRPTSSSARTPCLCPCATCVTGSRESHRRIQQHERQTTPSLHFLLIHEHLHGEGQPAAPVSRTNQAAILQMGESPPMGILAAGQRRHHAPRGGTLTSPEKFLKCSPPRWATRNPSRHCCPWRRRWQIPSPPRASRTSTRGRTPRRARRRAHQVLSHHVQLSDLFKVIADRVQTIKDFIVANDVVLMEFQDTFNNNNSSGSSRSGGVLVPGGTLPSSLRTELKSFLHAGCLPT